MRRIFHVIIGLLIFSTFVSGCDDSVEFSNTPPGSLSITKSKCYMGPGDDIELSGSATDADGDEVTYRWRAEGGEFIPSDGTGPDVTWVAPSGEGAEGTYRVTLVATDGLDEATRGMDIEVGRSIVRFSESVTLDQTDLPYIVQWNGQVSIGEGVTVTIGAGVTMIFNATTSGIYVRGGGALVVNGTAEDRVLMTSNVCPDEDRTWSGVTIDGAGSSGDISSLSMIYTSSGMIVEEGATLTASDLLIDGSEGDGLTVRDGGIADVTGGHFWENRGGIYVDNGTLSIQSSEARYNADYGFKIYGTAGQHSVLVTGCTISNNSVFGFLLGLEARPVVNGCEIFLNRPAGDPVAVELSPGYSNTEDIDMTGNYWGVTTAPEISAQINLNGADVTVDFSGFLASPPLE